MKEHNRYETKKEPTLANGNQKNTKLCKQNGKNNADITKSTNNIQQIEEHVKTITKNRNAHMYTKERTYKAYIQMKDNNREKNRKNKNRYEAKKELNGNQQNTKLCKQIRTKSK